ncbi:MAG: hypothetical protein HFF06_03920 [Oscillospiraceae bacterium]|jgi:hypothetical protein|nr:hypothetical protein [Oscillospiraceae bacterium]
MTNQELNEYILNYVEKDRTKSAIMLTAGWGTGKSYYIQNELCPFLKKREHQSIVVSLYGLKTIDEISKRLYFETRMKLLPKKSEGLEAGKLIGKTVLKGITSLAGMDLSMSNEDLQKLYETIDLTGKLIILEDVERSGINILEVLGFVNSLVEEDGVKVLLVANEEEILHYEHDESDRNGDSYSVSDKDTKIYLAVKEKTVSDTILFRGDIGKAIADLIRSFDNEALNMFADEAQVDRIITTMGTKRNHNLRTFQFACQKISDIYNKLGPLENDNAQTIFFGILALSMEIKSGSFPEWEGGDLLAVTMGYGDFPLYRFCYDYIRRQEFDIDMVQATFEAHTRLRVFDKNGETINDKALQTIFNFYELSEKEVINALSDVEHKLDDPYDIPIYAYHKLAYFMVELHELLGFDYTACKEKMALNMRKCGEEIDAEMLFLPRFEIKEDKKRQQFSDFLQVLKDSIRESLETEIAFSYEPTELQELYGDVVKNKKKVAAGHAFISKFDLDKILKMILTSTPAQLSFLRRILFSVYRYSGKEDFIAADRIFMEDLLTKLNEAINQNEVSMDRIALLQIGYLISNLKMYIEQLS